MHPYDDAHNAFMTLPPYSSIREARASAGWGSEALPGEPLSYEMPHYSS